MALQAQRDVYQAQLQRCQDTIIHLRTRYVDYARDPGKDNIIIIVRKYTTSASDKYYDFPDLDVIVEIQIVSVSMRLIDLKRKGMQSKNTATLG